MAKHVLRPGSAWHLLSVGERIMPLEWALVYFVFPALVFVFSPAGLRSLFLANARRQLLIFVPVCQLPVLLTGKLWYVDIAWPAGLVALAATAFWEGPGWYPRRLAVCAIMLLHGGRMAVGALVVFGANTNFRYRMKDDLPRYAYAKRRWEHEHRMPASWFALKAQQDTLQQCLANCVLLALPVLIPASNTQPHLSAIEVIGWMCWLGSWLFESVADVQKIRFAKETGKAQRGDASHHPAAGDASHHHATLGLAPYDGSAYWLWTICRHPNYLGEWCCWLSLVIAAAPSLVPVCRDSSMLVLIGFALGLFYTQRLLYDCLVHWTGAAPAEHFSALKRPGYAEYQAKVPCLWPKFVAPLTDRLGLDSFRRPQWQHG